MANDPGLNRRDFLKATTGGVLGLSLTQAASSLAMGASPPPQREIHEGVTTSRIVQGRPYDLAGKRIVFTNWYYVQPGDLNWLNDRGESVYVKGDEGPFGAHFVGVNAPRGIRFRIDKPNVMGPLEGPHRCIIQDGDIIRGWTDNEYYESSDGVEWTKKADLVLEGKISDGVEHIFIDPIAPESERFKSVLHGTLTAEEFDVFRKKRPDGWEPRATIHLSGNDEVACLFGGYSPDGIHWSTYPDPIVVEFADTLNTAYYDPIIRKYVLYTRFWSIGPRSDRVPPDIRNSWNGTGRRAIGRSESDDFRHFPPSEMMLEPTMEMLPSEVLYTNGRTTIPGAPDHHLLFPVVWNASMDDATRVVMATSHDGKVWHWAPGGSLLETQPFGQWDGGCIWVSPEMFEMPNGDWALPYSAHNVPHKYPRGQRVGGSGYAIWPKGRMIGLEASDRGAFVTMPVMPRGRKLKINALTDRTGGIRVQVERGDQSSPDPPREVNAYPGRMLADCDPIVGDQPWTLLTWKGESDLGFSENEAVQFRFEMDQSCIFGLEFV